MPTVQEPWLPQRSSLAQALTPRSPKLNDPLGQKPRLPQREITGRFAPFSRRCMTLAVRSGAR
jgi:hypothetical protein